MFGSSGSARCRYRATSGTWLPDLGVDRFLGLEVVEVEDPGYHFAAGAPGCRR